MGTLLVYMMKSSLCLATFYLFYRLLLSRETFHRFNRVALISLMLLSCAVPFLQLSVHNAPVVSRQLLSVEDLIMMASMDVEASVADAATRPTLWPFILLIIYLAGMLLFLVREVWSGCSMWRLIRSGEVVAVDGGTKVVAIDGEVSPFSWMNYIILSREDYENPDCISILTHERAHIRLHHSCDILLADLCIMLQWFNPASWLMKRELQQIHEFEADEAVLRSGINAKNYQLLLIKKAVGARLYSIANSLNQSSLKKRITMMFKKKSNPWARAKYAFVLPLTAVAVVAFARPEVNEELREISSAKVSDLTSIVETEVVKSAETLPVAVAADSLKGKVADVVKKTEQKNVPTEAMTVADKMPEYPGGIKAFMDMMMSNMIYPEKAKQEGTEGRVIVQFDVNVDGTLSDVNVARSVSPELDAEAVRLIGLSEKWTPGESNGVPVKVKYTVPVSFKLTGSNTDTKRPDESVSKLIIVDGKTIDKSELNSIDPGQIESMTIFKGDDAVAKYGEDAKNGAIVITLKK
jgi:TonB family protein